MEEWINTEIEDLSEYVDIDSAFTHGALSERAPHAPHMDRLIAQTLHHETMLYPVTKTVMS